MCVRLLEGKIIIIMMCTDKFIIINTTILHKTLRIVNFELIVILIGKKYNSIFV